MRLNDTPRKYITADRKVRAILANIYRRWPNDNQAAMAILSTVIGTRLACDHEERTTHHPRFTRAMVAYAVLNLVRRDDGTARDPVTRNVWIVHTYAGSTCTQPSTDSWCDRLSDG